jgi:hypothetical protein
MCPRDSHLDSGRWAATLSAGAAALDAGAAALGSPALGPYAKSLGKSTSVIITSSP